MTLVPHEAPLFPYTTLFRSCGGDTFMEAGREIEKIGSTGRAIAHVEIEIRDDAGNRLPSGENGEICLRGRSEEHTSELQSPMYLVCRLLLEKKKERHNQHTA